MLCGLPNNPMIGIMIPSPRISNNIPMKINTVKIAKERLWLLDMIYKTFLKKFII